MSSLPVATHAIICTRTTDQNDFLKRLLDYYEDVGVNVELIVGAKSMFQGYTQGIKQAKPKGEDVIILCHDDINIMSSKQIFCDTIQTAMNPKVGFVGITGCPEIPQSGFWRDGGVTGVFFLGESYQACKMMAGNGFGTAMFLDGLFLAAQWKKMKKVGTKCPDYLHDGWHFYDIHMTNEMNNLGYENITFPLFVLHSPGAKEDAGFNDDWMAARVAFCEHHGLSGFRPGQVA